MNNPSYMVQFQLLHRNRSVSTSSAEIDDNQMFAIFREVSVPPTKISINHGIYFVERNVRRYMLQRMWVPTSVISQLSVMVRVVEVQAVDEEQSMIIELWAFFEESSHQRVAVSWVPHIDVLQIFTLTLFLKIFHRQGRQVRPVDSSLLPILLFQLDSN